MSNKEREERITKLWKQNKCFEQSVSGRSKDKQYVFYDGPPFATGLPHYGHILALTSKDLFPRYWTMKGYRVERRWGWDTHGLPIESIAEKDLGLNGKQDIEAYGVEKFNDYAKSKVFTFIDEWKKTVDRMGKWIDFDNSYKTMDNSYIESVWWAFKTLHEAGYVYEGYKVLMFCPQSQTPISNFEVQMDNSYKMVTDKTATVAFKIKDKQNEFLLAWTTTPWTLMANVAIAINTKLEYVKVKKGPFSYIMAKNLVEQVLPDNDGMESVNAQDLVGLEYERLYDLPVDDPSKKGWYVIDGEDEVTDTDGTGLVHMAPYGEFDYKMILKYKLPFLEHLDNQGKMQVDYKHWKGMFFKKLDAEVLADLEDRQVLIKADSYTHSYPYSPRYNVPLFYKPVPSWFIDVQKVKQKLLEKNQDINWVPGHLKDGRFHKSMEGAPDWNISRNRFWASSLPVWKSEDGKIVKIIGSIKELQELAVDKSLVPDDVDLHKHTMDKVQIKDPETGTVLTRIPEVFDCWFESGSMPFAAHHYPFENEIQVELHHPADFVSEYIPQTRAWFYVMHLLSVLLFDRIAFRNVVATGTILAADGTKMSKSKNNFPDPNDMFDKYGADALRFYLMQSQLMKGNDINFKEEQLSEVYRKVLVLVENVTKLYCMYNQACPCATTPANNHVLDKWITSRVHHTLQQVQEQLDAYDTTSACATIVDFINELSTWYVRRSRDRLKAQDGDAIQTFGYVLDTLAKILAPTTPFIAEDMYHMINNTTDTSVHLQDWPTVGDIDEKLEQTMQQVREIVSKALDAREKEKISVRQALAKITVTGPEFTEEFSQLIMDEVNVKAVVYKTSEEDIKVELDTQLTPELIQEGIMRDFVRKINNVRKQKGMQISDRIVLHVDGDIEVLEAVKAFAEDIKKSVQADDIVYAVEDGEVVKVNKKEMTVSLVKL